MGQYRLSKPRALVPFQVQRQIIDVVRAPENPLRYPVTLWPVLDKINLVLGDEKLKAELSEEVFKNAAKFSWKNTAQKTLGVYRKIYKY